MYAELIKEIRDGENMTDYQFKALMKMVAEIIESKDSLEDAVAAVRALSGEPEKKPTGVNEKTA